MGGCLSPCKQSRPIIVQQREFLFSSSVLLVLDGTVVYFFCLFCERWWAFSFSLTHAVCQASLGCCSPPLARWIHVNRRRTWLCACIPFAITRSRLLPVQIAAVGTRDFRFTIPDASRCPAEGRLHLRFGIGRRKSGRPRSGSSATENSRFTRCTMALYYGPLTYVDTGLYGGECNDYNEVQTQEDLCWARRIDFVMKYHRIPRWEVE